MKNIFFGAALSAITLAACNSSSNKSSGSRTGSNETQGISQTDETMSNTSSSAEMKNAVSIKEIVSIYLKLKNDFADDNTNGAATAGTVLDAAFKNFNRASLTSDQKKTFEDIGEDARENAEHIGTNGGNIEHQREHFELLSKDIYDLVKAFGGGQTLYKDFCPMYNNGKGAFWLSETKEIKNPYFGKAMPACGTIQEVLDQL